MKSAWRLLSLVAVLTLPWACGDADLQTNNGNAGRYDRGDIDGGAAAPGGRDGGTTETESGSSGVTVKARVIVEPSDKGASLLSAIEGAKKSIHMTMYLLTSTPFIDALIAQKNAGREVKVILNQTFPQDGNPNQAAYTKLTTAGVEVIWASSMFVYTHEKCVILDAETATARAWIMTMNVTPTSMSSNREYLVVDEDADDVAQAENIFQSDFAGKGESPSGKLVVSPTNARSRIQSLVNSAKTSLDVEAETFSDAAMTKALVAAHERGVHVRVVMADESPTSAQTSAIAALKAASIPVVKGTALSIHAKAMVVDGARAYTGSINFTFNSLMNNRELGVILGSAESVELISNTIAGDFAAGTPL